MLLLAGHIENCSDQPLDHCLWLLLVTEYLNTHLEKTVNTLYSGPALNRTNPTSLTETDSKMRFLTKLQSLDKEVSVQLCFTISVANGHPTAGPLSSLIVRLCVCEGIWDLWGWSLLQMCAGTPLFPFWHKRQSIWSISLHPSPLLLAFPALCEIFCLEGFLLLSISPHPKAIHS